MSTALAAPPPAVGTVARQEFGGAQVARTAETSSSALAAQATALVQARYVVALQRPRDWDTVRVAILKEVERPGFAQSAWYRKPVGQGVEGLSIRFAEAAMRCMGNVMAESPVVYDDDDRRLVRVVVTDLESNLTLQKDIVIGKTVERRSLRKGQEALSVRVNSTGETTYLVRATEDDLLAKESALVSKAVRTSVLRVLPGDIQDAARDRIKAIISGAAAKDPDGERRKVVDAFAGLNIAPPELRRYLGHDVGTASPAEIVDLRGVYSAIKGGETSWAEVMDGRLGADESEKPRTVEALKDRLQPVPAAAPPAPTTVRCKAHPDVDLTPDGAACWKCKAEADEREAAPASLDDVVPGEPESAVDVVKRLAARRRDGRG